MGFIILVKIWCVYYLLYTTRSKTEKNLNNFFNATNWIPQSVAAEAWIDVLFSGESNGFDIWYGFAYLLLNKNIYIAIVIIPTESLLPLYASPYTYSKKKKKE